MSPIFRRAPLSGPNVPGSIEFPRNRYSFRGGANSAVYISDMIRVPQRQIRSLRIGHAYHRVKYPGFYCYRMTSKTEENHRILTCSKQYCLTIGSGRSKLLLVTLRGNGETKLLDSC